MPEINLIENVSLKDRNSFGIDVQAARWAEITEPSQLTAIPKLAAEQTLLFLGGGSNILFTHDFEGLVIKVSIKGKKVVREDENNIWIQIGAGENWHDLVMYTVGQGWGGIENLALIPGQAGTAPIQNIGAYGIEVKDVLEELEYFDIASGTMCVMLASECQFAYRDSIFKRELKGRAIITSITMKLQKRSIPNTTYGAIKDVLKERNILQPGPADIADAVISIRQSKLPDPAVLGNAGSFFKNPVIDKETADEIIGKYPGIPSFPADEGMVKLAAGWMIEQAGWKGKRLGDAGVSEKQALVLVNHGSASGRDILDLAHTIQSDIRRLFGIELVTEVNIL